MNEETELEKYAGRSEDGQATTGMLSVLPDGLNVRDVNILLDTVFYTVERAAQKNKLSVRQVSRIKAEHRDAVELLSKSRDAVICGLCSCAMYQAIRTVVASLSKLRPPKTALGVASLVYSLSKLKELANLKDMAPLKQKIAKDISKTLMMLESSDGSEDDGPKLESSGIGEGDTDTDTDTDTNTDTD